MHSAAVHLASILAAEKSKVPFYVAGGTLVAWAVIVSAGLGLRRIDFPGTLIGERAVITISAALVLAAVSTAVITAGPAAKATSQPGSRPSPGSAANAPPGAPANAGAPPVASAKVPPASTAPGKTPAPVAPPAPSSLKLAASTTGLLSYDTRQLSAKAGTVRIAFTNGSPLEHNVVVAHGATVLGTTPTFAGGAKTLTLRLRPGTYSFYCSVPGHRQAGMEGKLVVS